MEKLPQRILFVLLSRQIDYTLRTRVKVRELYSEIENKKDYEFLSLNRIFVNTKAFCDFYCKASFARELFLLFADFYTFFTVSRLRILYTFVIVFLFKTMKEKDAWR